MKYNRILSAALTCSAMASLLVGCYEDYDDYSVGAQNKNLHVAFINDGALSVDKTATDLVLTLVRSTDPAADHSALEVPIIVNELGLDCKVPSSATFAAGKDTTEIVVALPEKMELNVPYYINISLPEEYYATYDEYTDHAFMLTTTVTKEDYEKYADANVDLFDFMDTEENFTKSAVVYYSPMLKTYRIRSLYDGGNPLYFLWNKEENKVSLANANGKTVSSWSTGIDYFALGIVVANLVEGENPVYDKEKNSIVFSYTYDISGVGSWGKHSMTISFVE